MTKREYQYHLYKRRSRFKIIPENKILYARKRCPICSSNIKITANAWEYCEKTKLWMATEIEVNCTKEPDLESDEWEEWFNWHYSMPYVDWLPLEIRLLKSIQKKYRYKLKFK